MINSTDFYHPDGVVCADRWSCVLPDHTTVPPKCGMQGAGRAAAGCELPAGHPGPHVLASYDATVATARSDDSIS
jgi:hypothetical protein